MTTLLQSLEELQDWDGYHSFSKLQLKSLADGDAIYVSKNKVDFEINNKPWAGYAVLFGPKGTICEQKLRKDGVLFHAGVCRLKGKELVLEGLPDKAMRGASRTFVKLQLGYKVFGVKEGEGEPGDQEVLADAAPASGAAQTAGAREASAAGAAGATAGELARKAQLIEKAVGVWRATEQVVTKELRKLQKAILDHGDPRGKPVIQGLEGIRTRLEKLDDEAQKAADAAARGDQKALEEARQDFVKKVNKILSQVQGDELIKDADSNPFVPLKLHETLTKSLNQLMKAV